MKTKDNITFVHGTLNSFSKNYEKIDENDETFFNFVKLNS